MNIIRDILREELNVKFFPGERLTIDDFSSPIKYTAYSKNVKLLLPTCNICRNNVAMFAWFTPLF